MAQVSGNQVLAAAAVVGVAAMEIDLVAKELHVGDVALKEGDSICSIITNESAEFLGLQEGMEAYALFKASAVILGRDLHDAKVSARNLLCGTVDRIEAGVVNAEVMVALAGGNVLTSIVTDKSVKRLSLAKGEHVCALFKSSSVIVGVDA